MNDVSEYRVMLAVDLDGPSGPGDAVRPAIRETLARCLAEAFRASGVDWDACLRSDHGDGLRVIAPNRTAPKAIVHPLVHELAVRLRTHDRLDEPSPALAPAPPAPIRVRVAMHAGSVVLGPDGTVAGRPLEVLAGMLDAQACRDALARSPEPAPVALVVSQHFYEEAVHAGCPGIDPMDFRRVGISEPEYAAPAWLWVTSPATLPAAISASGGAVARSGRNA